MTKKFKYQLFIVLFSFFAQNALEAGIPVWTFAPLTPTTVVVPSNGTAIIQYRVTNQSRVPHLLVMAPIPGIVQIVSAGNCPNPFYLTAKNSCTLTLQVNGSLLRRPFFGGPVVCHNANPLQCYRPSQANALNIHVGPPIPEASFAYITNDFGSGVNNVTRCEVLANGNLADNCTITAAGINFDNPTGIVINASGTLAYITNSNTNNVSKCLFDADHNLPVCTNSGNNLSLPAGITLNASETWAYIANAGSNDVSKCGFDINGDLNNCINFPGMNFPVGIVINPAGTLIYISNNAGDDISKCELDVSGDLMNCGNSGSGLLQPFGLAINSTGTWIYIVNAGLGNVSKCQFAVNGDLSNCVPAGAPGLSEPRYIVLNTAGTFAYIANALGNNVTKCAIDMVGDLVDCSPMGDTMNGPTGIQLKEF